MRIMICSDLHWDDDQADNQADHLDSYLEPSPTSCTAASSSSQSVQHNAVFRSLINSPAFKTLTEDDLVCIAGDVAKGTEGIRCCLTELRQYTQATIVGVMGNHDYAGEMLAASTVDLIQATLPARVHLLENQSIELNGIRLLGCTLWTNPAADCHEDSQRAMPEYSTVEHQNGDLITVADTRYAHQQSVDWLNGELAKPFNGKTVVMTHHAPSFISQHNRHRFSALSAFFCVDLEPLIATHQPALWIHGHLHDPVDYELHTTRIMSAPLGYPDERSPGWKPVVIEF